jgi:intein/homing endonuclease
MVLPDIQSEYRKDFVRGYFDGDGSAFLLARKKESNLLGTSFASASKIFLEQIGDILKEDIGLVPKIYKYIFKNDKWADSYKLRYGALESVALYHYMYNHNPEIFLNRKKIIFEQWISERGENLPDKVTEASIARNVLSFLGTII